MHRTFDSLVQFPLKWNSKQNSPFYYWTFCLLVLNVWLFRISKLWRVNLYSDDMLRSYTLPFCKCMSISLRYISYLSLYVLWVAPVVLWTAKFCISPELSIAVHFSRHKYHVNGKGRIFPLWHNSPMRAKAASFFRFLDHTQWHIKVSRSPLDERSASFSSAFVNAPQWYVIHKLSVLLILHVKLIMTHFTKNSIYFSKRYELTAVDYRKEWCWYSDAIRRSLQWREISIIAS